MFRLFVTLTAGYETFNNASENSFSLVDGNIDCQCGWGLFLAHTKVSQNRISIDKILEIFQKKIRNNLIASNKKTQIEVFFYS